MHKVGDKVKTVTKIYRHDDIPIGTILTLSHIIHPGAFRAYLNNESIILWPDEIELYDNSYNLLTVAEKRALRE